MAPWILYALIAAVTVAFVGVIDKLVLSKWMRDPLGSFFAFGVIETASGLAALAILGFPRLPLATTLIALAAGAALTAAAAAYFEAIKVEEVSRVLPLYGLTPLIVAALAATFLGEVLPPSRYVGVALTVAGAVLLSIKRFRGWRFGKGMGWMALGILLVSAGAVASKYALEDADPWTVFAYLKLGTPLVAAPLAFKGYRAFREAARRHGAVVLAFMGLSEGLTTLSSVFLLLAASSGYITLVNALMGTQQFFLLLFTVLLSVYRPDILKEELGKGALIRKIAALLLMSAGVLIVTR